MLFFRIMKSALAKWWDKIGYALLSSVMGALNPVLFVWVGTVVWILTGNITLAWEQFPFFAMVLGLSLFSQAFFPTSVAAVGVQKMIKEGEHVYFKDYFKNYFLCLKMYTPRALLLLVLSAAAVGLLIFAALFYYRFISWAPLKFGVTFLVLILLSLLGAYQGLLLSALVYRDKKGLKEQAILAGKMLILEAPAVIFTALVDLFLLVLLSLGQGLSVLLYYGISSYIRLYTYSLIMDKYSPGSEKEEGDWSAENETRAWTVLMDRRRAAHGEKKD